MNKTTSSKDNTDYYRDYEVDKLVDEKIKAGLKEYDTALWEKIATRFLLELSTVKLWIAVGKFVAAAVALLFIGTLYQLFVSVANTVGLK
jgi:hypothetical protein